MINCPIDVIMLCQECRYNTDDKCWWFFPAKPLGEILTTEEQLEYKETHPEEVIHRHIHYNSDVSKKQWQRIDTLSGELKYLKKKLIEHTAYKKKEKEMPF